MTAGAYFAVAFCYVPTLEDGVVTCQVDDRLPNDADPAEIDRLLAAGTIRFQPDEQDSEQAPAVVTPPADAPKKRTARKKAAEEPPTA